MGFRMRQTTLEMGFNRMRKRRINWPGLDLFGPGWRFELGGSVARRTPLRLCGFKLVWY